jgi:hypothetical protein
MDFCRTVELVYEALPFRPLRAWLIRAHMEKCPRCQAGLASRDEARGLLVAPDRVGDAEALWRRIALDAGRLPGRAAAAPAAVPWRARWAAAAALAVLVAATGFWLLRETGGPGPAPGAADRPERFEIAYVNVGGAPAQTFVYRPQGTDTVFVWAQRTP